MIFISLIPKALFNAKDSLLQTTAALLIYFSSTSKISLKCFLGTTNIWPSASGCISKKAITRFIGQLRNLKKGEASYVIGITIYADYPKEIAEFFKRLQEKRDLKKVDTYFLLSENARGSFKYMEESKYSFVKHLSYASLVSVNIYQNITIIGIFLKNPILLKIKSKAVADNFIKYFKILWDLAKD